MILPRRISMQKDNQGSVTDHLSPGAWRGPPEPARVCRDTDHRAAGHEVAHRVSPPRVVVVLGTL